MTIAIPTKARTIEDTDLPIFDRLRTDDGTYLVQADLSSIAYAAYDLSDPGTAITTGTLTISDVIFDTLQQTADNALWGEAGGSTIGFNFAAILPAACFPTGGRTVRVEITFTPNSGSVLRSLWDVQVIKRLAG